MPGFTDLLDTHADVHARFVAGQTVYRRFFFADDDDAPIDFTGVTGVCQILDYADHTLVLLDFDVAGTTDGWLTISKAAAAFPASLAGGGVGGERYRWRLTLTKAATGESVGLWGPATSTVTVVPA